MLLDSSSEVRKAAVSGLSNFSQAASEIVPVFLEHLNDDDLEFRKAVVIGLGNLGKKAEEAQGALKPLLESPNKTVRSAAAISLSNLGKPEISMLPLYIEALGTGDSHMVRAGVRACVNLAVVSPDPVLETLVNQYVTADKVLSENIITALKGIKGRNDRMFRALDSLYDGVDGEKRIRIFSAMSEIDAKGDFLKPVLTKALSDPDSALRNKALMTCGRYRPLPSDLKSHVLKALEDSEFENRALATKIVARSSQQVPEAVPILLKMASEQGGDSKAAAIAALGAFKDSTKETFQVIEAGAKDKHTEVRTAAIAALKNLGRFHTEAVTPVLEKLLQEEKDPGTKRNLVFALNSLGKRVPGMIQEENHTRARSGVTPGEEIGNR